MIMSFRAAFNFFSCCYIDQSIHSTRLVHSFLFFKKISLFTKIKLYLAHKCRWILKQDYLTASREVGKFLDEEPFEWYKNGLSEDGAINLEASRKWRLMAERTGHGAFHDMRIIVYGECITPPLVYITMKLVSVLFW